MLELCDMRARDVKQRSIGLDDAARDERSHVEMVIFHSNAFEIMPRENQSPEVLINGLQKRLSGRTKDTSSADMLVTSVTIDAHIVSEIAFTSGPECLDSKYVAFFHALTGGCLDKRDLLVTVNLVGQDVVTAKVPNRFDRNRFLVEFDFIALHYLLNSLADVIHPGIYASFLCEFLSSSRMFYVLTLTLSPVLVAALTAASRLS